MASRGCINNPNSFCYICGEYVVKKRQRNITDFVKKAYYAYFGMKLGDQEKKWAPHIVCHTCVEHLRKWTQGKIKSLPFAIPMVWREPASHEDCYFCLTKIKGYNCKNKANVVYPEIISAI